MGEADGIAVRSARELLDDWLAVLTLLGERDESPHAMAELVGHSIGRHSFDTELQAPLSAADRARLAGFTRAIGRCSTGRAPCTGSWTNG